MARTFGLLFSGFAVKLYAVGAALYVAHMAYATLVPALTAANNAMTVLG